VALSHVRARRYARQADNCQLQMDSLWRLGDWDALKRHVLPRAQVDDGSWAHMVHAYVHLQEGNIVEGEQNITNAMKAALIRCARHARTPPNHGAHLPDLRATHV
jgi:hypothetical protein